MKNNKIMSLLFLALVATHLQATVPYIGLRSQSSNDTRTLYERRISSGDYITARRELGVTAMYQKSRATAAINRCLFGSDLFCDDTILIQGSHFNDGARNEQAWLADYFGLPTDFAGQVSFNPTVKNSIVELGGWYACEDNGFFIDFQMPIVHTVAQLDACEVLQNTGELGYIDGYFAPDAVDTMHLLSSAQQFFEQQVTPNLGNGTIFRPLLTSRWLFAHDSCNSAQKQTQLSDVIIRVGYDALTTDNGGLRVYARVSAPAGNRPDGIFLFEPVVGNGGLWGVGGGISGEWSFFNAQRCDASGYFFIDGYAQHLFKGKQKCSFDLVGKPNSRYMLAQKLGAIRQEPSLSGASDAGIEFQNEYAPVANLTYGCINVSAAIEGELTARVVGFCGAWQAAVGYNLWGRSAEKISYRSTPCALQDGLWALKGDAQVIGFRITDNEPVHLAAVQNADIHGGTNRFPTGFDGLESEQNPGVVNRVAATTGAGIDVVALPFAIVGQTNSSNPAPTIGLCDVALRGTSGLSNSIFGYLAYAPTCTCSRVEPRVEVGAQAEFGASSCAQTESSCGSQRCSLSTWGVWATVALGF